MRSLERYVPEILKSLVVTMALGACADGEQNKIEYDTRADVGSVLNTGTGGTAGGAGGEVGGPDDTDQDGVPNDVDLCDNAFDSTNGDNDYNGPVKSDRGIR